MRRSLNTIACKVLRLAKAHHLTLVAAESCTAGLLSQTLSDAPGAAEHFHGGFVTYTKDQKVCVLGVAPHLLFAKGAVCPEVAEAMAEGALLHSMADLAVAITGVAGPEPDEDGNEVGRVCLAVGRRDARAIVIEKRYGAIGRDAVRERAIADVLAALIEAIEETMEPADVIALPALDARLIAVATQAA